MIDLHTHILPQRWPSWTQRTGYAGWVELAHEAGGCGCGGGSGGSDAVAEWRSGAGEGRREESARSADLSGESARGADVRAELARAKMLATTSVDGSTAPKFFREVDARLWSPAVRLEMMDRIGVAMQVLSTVPVMFASWAKAGDARDLHRLLNDHIAEVCRGHPERFAGLGVVPMQDEQMACAELERCVRDLGMRGVQIGTHVNGANLDDDRIVRVLEHAEKIGACVFVHPWDMLGGERMARYWMPWLVAMPTETTIAMMSVIFGGVLDRLPTLRMCFAHGGGSFPGTIGRITHGQRARPDLFPAGAKEPAAYLARDGEPARVWVDSLTHDARALGLLVEMFSARRVALGTDYPFPLGEDVAGELIASMGFDAMTAGMLRGGAAREFLGA